MSQVKGTVQEVKAFNTAAGKTMYSLKIDGNLYGVGSYKPKCDTGDIIEVEFSMNGKYMNADTKTLRVVGKEEVKASAAPAGGNSYDSRQSIISKHAALNTSISFVELLLKADAIPGITKTSKVDERFEVLDALVKDKMAEFYFMNTGETLVDPTESTGAASAGGATTWQ